VAEDALFAVEKRDVTLARGRVYKAGVERDQAGLLAQSGDVDGAFPFGSLDDWKFQFVSVHMQCGFLVFIVCTHDL